MAENTLPIHTQDLLKGLQQGASFGYAAAGGGGGGSFLKLARDGLWVYGADETEVEPESKWAIDPNSFQQGFVSWGTSGEGKLGEEMRPVSEPAVQRTDLPDTGAPWGAQSSALLVCISGEDTGTAVQYSTSSKGGLKALSDLMRTIIKQAAVDPTKLVPIVTLDVDSYRHKVYNKIYTPVLSIVGWAGNDDTPETTAADTSGQAESTDSAASGTSQRRRRRAAA